MGFCRTLFGVLRYDAGHVLGELDRVERLTHRKAGIGQELVELGERDLVQGRMREMGPLSNHEVYVHRGWGTVSAVPDREAGISHPPCTTRCRSAKPVARHCFASGPGQPRCPPGPDVPGSHRWLRVAVHGFPQPGRGQRHVGVAQAVGLERVHDRVDDRRR
jgi:hypothetical protein